MTTKATKLQKRDAVIYCRVSTKEQQENLSLPVQEKTCRTWCEQNGYNVLRVFKEAESAKTVNRAEFQRMLEFCALNKKTVGVLLFYDASRFSRENSEYHQVKAILKTQGIATRAATQHFDDSPVGELTESLLSAYATFDNRMRAVRTTEGMKAAIKNGHWVHRAPLGYENVQNVGQNEPNLRPDGQRAPLIAHAFELLGTNTCRKADALAVVTKMGLTDISGRPVSPQSFDKILRNPTYAGWIVSSWGIKARGLFEPLVSDALFDRVQSILAGRRPAISTRLSQHPDFPLRVFVRCGTCGTPMTGSYSTGKLGTKYGYYHCREKTCRESSVPKDQLHVDFAILLEGVSPKKEVWSLLKAVLSEVWETKLKQRRESAERRMKIVSALQVRKQKLIDAMLDGRLKQSLFEEQLEILEREAEKHSEPGEMEHDGVEIESLLAFAEWFLNNAATVWMGASSEKKIRIQEAVFPSGVSFSKEGFRTLGKSSIFKYLAPFLDDSKEMASPEGFEPSLTP